MSIKECKCPDNCIKDWRSFVFPQTKEFYEGARHIEKWMIICLGWRKTGERKNRNSYAMFFINHRSLNKSLEDVRLQWFVLAITVNTFKTARCIFDDVYDNSCLFKWYLFMRFLYLFTKKGHFSRICWSKGLSSLHLLSAEWWKSSAPIYMLLLHHTTKLSVSSDWFLDSKYDEFL